MREIQMLEDFQEAKRSRNQYIVITDSANGNRVHASHCSFVKPENFIDKVIMNGNKNGRYYLVSSPADARQWFGAVECKKCLY